MIFMGLLNFERAVPRLDEFVVDIAAVFQSHGWGVKKDQIPWFKLFLSFSHIVAMFVAFSKGHIVF